MKTIYVKVTVPALPEAVRVSFNTAALLDNVTPENGIKAMRRMAAKRGIDATYELATAEEYKAHRAMVRKSLEVQS